MLLLKENLYKNYKEYIYKDKNLVRRNDQFLERKLTHERFVSSGEHTAWSR